MKKVLFVTALFLIALTADSQTLTPKGSPCPTEQTMVSTFLTWFAVLEVKAAWAITSVKYGNCWFDFVKKIANGEAQTEHEQFIGKEFEKLKYSIDPFAELQPIPEGVILTDEN